MTPSASGLQPKGNISLPTALEANTGAVRSKSNKHKREVSISIVSKKYSKAGVPESHYLKVSQTDKETKDSIKAKRNDGHKDEEVQRQTPSFGAVSDGKWIDCFRKVELSEHVIAHQVIGDRG